MTASPHSSRRTAAAALLSLAAAPAAFALQGLRSSAATSLLVPLSAGSSADLIARRYAAAAAEASGVHTVVENLPGAGGVIASRELLKRPADGRAVLMGYSGLVCNLPLLSKVPLDFDPLTDFVPACIFSRAPFILFAAKGFPADNLDDLRKLARSTSEPFHYVGSDVGGANHLAAEVLFQRLGIRGNLVPYRNNQQAYMDVAEGRVQLGIYVWTNIAPLFRSDRIKVLSVLSGTPLAANPQLPTVASQGYGGFDMQGWFGLFLAKGTPPALVAEHERRMQLATRNPDFTSFMADSGQEVMFRDRQESRAFIDAEVERYRGVLLRLKLI